MTNNDEMGGKTVEGVTVIDQEVLGLLVQRRRKDLGLSLEEAANRFGVSKRLVLDLEKGRRGVRIDTVVRILNLLGFDLLARRRSSQRHA